VNALAVIEALAKNDMFMPGINQADYGAELTEFVNERAVYMIDGGWRVNNLVGELTDEQKTYVSLNTFPDIPDQKGQSGSTAMVAGTGYGMNANLDGEKPKRPGSGSGSTLARRGPKSARRRGHDGLHSAGK
jgi:raffinose/stachyose/melibiose transport system substrate-binding protein